MIAGGTGLAPMMSMLDCAARHPGEQTTSDFEFWWRRVRGYSLATRSNADKFGLPSLQARISIDRGEPSATVRIGNPVQAIAADDVGNPDTVAYLCGPPGMIAAAHTQLCRLGVAPQNIFTEQFVASEAM